ncbi:hypothetical protein ACOJTA_13015 [Malaciobacter sp. WC5094]
MANDDFKYDNSEKEEWEERNKSHWVKNGLNEYEADQLIEDINNDANSGDPDAETFADPSIQDKVNKYGGFVE